MEEHSKEKHGGLQPSEQKLQTQSCREEKLEQSECRKEKAKEEARQTKYFLCKECVEGFNTKRELDIHMMDKHIFICGECLRIFKIKAERDTRMEKDHKGMSTEMTKQEKLLVEEWHKRESREEKGQTSHGDLEEGLVKVRSQEGTAGDGRKEKEEKEAFSYTDQRRGRTY